MSGGKYDKRISRPSARKLRSIQDRTRPGRTGATEGGADAIYDRVSRNPRSLQCDTFGALSTIIRRARLAVGPVPPAEARLEKFGRAHERQGRWKDSESVRLSVLGLDGEGRSGVRTAGRPSEPGVSRRGQGALDQASRDGHHRDPRLSLPRGRRGHAHAPGDPARRDQARAARGDRIGGVAGGRADAQHGCEGADAARRRGRVQEVITRRAPRGGRPRRGGWSWQRRTGSRAITRSRIPTQWLRTRRWRGPPLRR